MNDWTTLLDAAYRINAAEHAIDERHRIRFHLVRTEDDGSIIVSIDRHPSHDGRFTVGERSPAFHLIRRSYRISASAPAFELIQEENLGLTLNVDALATEELETFWDVKGDELREAVDGRRPDQSVSEVCRAAADDWNFELTWTSEYIGASELRDDVDRVRARLVELLVVRVTEELN